jgi:protein phosphatase
MKNNLLVSSYSEKGRRDNNEDFFITTYNKAGQLLVVVCDGIGGDDDSQVASRLLANHFLITFKKKRVRNFARYYNHVLKKATKDITKHTPEGKTMGTTICAVMVTGNIVETANMGDSRIYYYSYQNNN